MEDEHEITNTVPLIGRPAGSLINNSLICLTSQSRMTPKYMDPSLGESVWVGEMEI